MSIYYSGTFKRSAGLISAIVKQLDLVNLKPVKKIQVQFDPFHPQAETVRDFLFHITGPKVAATNLKCAIKTNIVCDRSDPFIKVDLAESGNSVRLLATNLTVLEILQQFNKHISSLVKPDETVGTNIVQTKSEKKKARRK
ncbi:hypothetical protein ILUMI_01412 [Ignelater luminosus]|uniref:Large ribosomal subunit protein mL53 n=1 Tax=Ignelater luminosus TaxID=2038154 RepID=A0A8K0DK24_IGNLU|nr:hypothetical protein ILUMI_01412 [Ignelater luminosus]